MKLLLQIKMGLTIIVLTINLIMLGLLMEDNALKPGELPKLILFDFIYLQTMILINLIYERYKEDEK